MGHIICPRNAALLGVSVLHITPSGNWEEVGFTQIIHYRPLFNVAVAWQHGVADFPCATLLALSLIAPLRDISLQTVHVWFFGALFGIGLSLSGMTNNAVVISFLNFDKMWNPALMFVLAFGSGTFSLTYWIREYRGSTKPLYGEQNHLPTKTAIDLKLVVRSVFFGIGWGLAGLCPGPVVAVLSVPAIGTIYVPSLIAGMKITEYISALDYPVEDDSEKVDEEVNLSDTLVASDP